VGFFDIFKIGGSSKTSSSSSNKKRSGSRKRTGKGSSRTGTTTIRAERRIINKETHRKQQELKKRAAATRQGSTRRRTFFKTREDYDAYLGSDKWKKKRAKVRDQSQGKCEICGKGGSTVHHLRYTEPGLEHRSHLAFVCNSCHRRIHGTQR
jgi:5-methylcytosine-specific restriction endonuclease McrA